MAKGMAVVIRVRPSQLDRFSLHRAVHKALPALMGRLVGAGRLDPDVNLG